MNKFYCLLLLSILALTNKDFAQSRILTDRIIWKGLVKEYTETGSLNEFLYFDGALTDESTGLPLYTSAFGLKSANNNITTAFDSAAFIPCGIEETAYLNSIQFSGGEIEIRTNTVIDRKVPVGVISFIPLRLNTLTGKFEKIVSFNLKITVAGTQPPYSFNSRKYADHSVLSTGEWFKIRTSQSGIHKITYSDLQSYGIDPAAVNPQHIRIYGNAGGMLPEANSGFRYDDLQENAIRIVGEEDGVFNEDDYILFFGMNPNAWTVVLGFFTYNVNLYDDYNYYYLTTSLGPGKRIQSEQSSSATPTQEVTKFNDYDVIEDEEINLIQSGKRWYGDVFGEVLEREYAFNFPDIITSDPVILKTEVANRTFVNEKMALQVNNQLNDTMILTLVSPSSTKFAQKKKKTLSFYTGSPEILVKFKYLPSTASSIAWLDYIMVNAQRLLRFGDGQLMFRQLSTVQEGAVSEFVISNSNPLLDVWDITNAIEPREIIEEANSGQLSFTVRTDSLREFIAFDGSLYYSPEFVETVSNQDLHSGGPFDMVIVTHPYFLSQANEIAAIHTEKDGFAINVVTTNQIYNEFSSGKQDPSAIRDYIKMLYDRYENQELRYVLLFGDGSFDPKDRYENNTNFIPAFQNEESWVTASSFVIDDFYGYLDENEGLNGEGQLDIGIGRIPSKTVEEADIAIRKIKTYLSFGEPVFGSWRSKICIIGDDEDGNLHMEQADSLSKFIPDMYNVKKIYLDAFPQITTPSGPRYPEVTEIINKTINNGVLILNYVGHGGKAGWAHERIIGTNDIRDWNNAENLAVFITATCEFSRFDEPELLTGGEMTFMNPNGGGIALFTTTRLAYAQANFTVNQRVLNAAFNPTDGVFPYLGDLIRYSKPPSQLSTRNFILMGDPALKLSYPKYEVRTVQVLNKSTQMVADTLHALDLATVQCEITDDEGNRVNNFNGKAYITVYDKITNYYTIGNDAYSYPVDFYCQDKVIWKGEASADSGSFEFTFLMPRDIAFNFGPGKMSFYAVSDSSDALGYNNSVVIGGMNSNAASDLQGPEIELFLNDLSFVSGDQTHENPVLLAFLEDESGINTSEGGIGHEITTVIDEDYLNEIILNEYYSQDIDSYQKGSITFPFYDLPDGHHTLTLKAWDNYNNSSEKSIEFVIDQGAILTLSEVKNQPNPFKDETTFTFNHNRPGDDLDISLEIFDLAGRKILTLDKTVHAEVSATPFFTWDGSDSKGNKIRSGVYIFTLSIEDELGTVTKQRQKLVKMD
jgi:hypothetical protein